MGGRGGNITITTEGLLGIESRLLNNVTNDINASSQSNIDGTISLDIPEVNVLKTTIDLSQRIIPTEIVISQMCQSSGSQENSFIIQGKSGVISQPTDPLNGDILITETNNSSISQTKIPKTVNSETLIVARGIIIQENGSVILTSYPTPGTPGYRSYQQKVDCHYQPEGSPQ